MSPIVSEEYKERKKQEILESAYACFAKKGFETSTVDDIVEHSGISKGAIYNYFKSKDEIYLALMESQTRKSFEKFTYALSEIKSAREKMAYLFRAYSENNPDAVGHKDYALVHFEFRLHSSRQPELKNALTERYEKFFVKMVGEIIKAGQSEGEFAREIEAKKYAEVFWTMINGVTLQATIIENYPYKAMLEEMQEMLLNKLTK